ncbi:amino acid transporter [Allokutzneria oryzae]|uniref:Amino acid transporter n=1 Tax=Allokutzneria oryzae TaxID=1378989 RepID=A0ABV6A4M2_9PSEU
MAEDLGRWAAASPAEVAARFADFDGPWWIAGGWAIEMAVATQSTVDVTGGRLGAPGPAPSIRAHDDIDVLVLREHHVAAHDVLAGWELWAADPPGTLRPWSAGERLPSAVHDVWCRPGRDEPWRIQIMIDESAGDEWISRRDDRVRRAVTEIGSLTADGVPFLVPEVQLYYKARDRRPKDDQDFDAVVSHLTPGQRSWLDDVIKLDAPDHPWRAPLRD